MSNYYTCPLYCSICADFWSLSSSSSSKFYVVEHIFRYLAAQKHILFLEVSVCWMPLSWIIWAKDGFSAPSSPCLYYIFCWYLFPSLYSFSMIGKVYLFILHCQGYTYLYAYDLNCSTYYLCSLGPFSWAILKNIVLWFVKTFLLWQSSLMIYFLKKLSHIYQRLITCLFSCFLACVIVSILWVNFSHTFPF